MAFIDDLRVYRDKLRFRIYKALYDYKAVKSGNDFNFSSIQHIVISKIDGKLGDTQVMTPFFANIKKHYPHIKITVITVANLAEIYDKCIKVDKVIVSPKKKPAKEQVQKMCQEILQIAPCDLLMLLDVKLRPREFYFINALKPPFIAGTADHLDCMNLHIEKEPVEHMSHYLNSFLQQGGLKLESIEQDYIPFNDPALSLQYKERFSGAKTIGFTPYGSGSARKLKYKTQLAMLTYIKEHTDYNVVLLLPPDETKLKHLLEGFLGDRQFKVPDLMTVRELCSVISSLDCMVSVDTANVHLSNAFDIGLFALYSDPVIINIWGPHPDKTNCVSVNKNKLIAHLDYADIKEDFEAFIDSYCR